MYCNKNKATTRTTTTAIITTLIYKKKYINWTADVRCKKKTKKGKLPYDTAGPLLYYTLETFVGCRATEQNDNLLYCKIVK